MSTTTVGMAGVAAPDSTKMALTSAALSSSRRIGPPGTRSWLHGTTAPDAARFRAVPLRRGPAVGYKRAGDAGLPGAGAARSRPWLRAAGAGRPEASGAGCRAAPAARAGGVDRRPGRRALGRAAAAQPRRRRAQLRLAAATHAGPRPPGGPAARLSAGGRRRPGRPG